MQTFHLILLCFHHKKCAKSHTQSQFTSKFIVTSIDNIFKSDGSHHTMQGFFLIGRRKKVKFRGIFGDRYVEKSTNFAGIFKANFAENQSIKKGRFCGYFLEANRFSADQTSVFNVFLTEVIICSFNNNTFQN